VILSGIQTLILTQKGNSREAAKLAKENKTDKSKQRPTSQQPKLTPHQARSAVRGRF
jgi:hypothetical protein